MRCLTCGQELDHNTTEVGVEYASCECDPWEQDEGDPIESRETLMGFDENDEPVYKQSQCQSEIPDWNESKWKTTDEDARDEMRLNGWTEYSPFAGEINPVTGDPFLEEVA